MKTSTSCTCHETADVCETGILERPRYFPRQLLTPAEMTLEQQYFRDRLRRHNRLMHGWGVVCGAVVCRVPEKPGSKEPEEPPKPQPWKVRVKTGYILGPYGDEILIDHERVVDLRTLGVTCASGELGEAADPWCAPVLINRDARTLFVAVRYKEIQARPVRIQPAGCGCDDAQCEYSRWRDGYEIGVLTECPESHQNPPKPEDVFEGPVPDCPDCPASPWVVLAQVDLDPDGTIRIIDNCSCRRMVISVSALWWRCKAPLEITTAAVEGDPSPGNDVTVTIEASGLPATLPVSSVDFGEGLTVNAIEVAEDQLSATLEVTIDSSANPGPRTLTIWDPAGCFVARLQDALIVQGTMNALPLTEKRKSQRKDRVEGK